MGDLKQDKRIGEFTTPLGKDELVLTRFFGTEGLGELFEYAVEAISETENINFDGAIGRSCSLKLKAHDRPDRIFNGIMVNAQWLGASGIYYHYRIVLRPWFWLCDQKADCRIFLNKSVTDIIQEVFSKGGFNDFELRTTNTYDKIEYCVQYRETDFAFVSRLMEQFGIYYFFEHSESKHMMIIADSPSSHKTIPGHATIPYIALGGADQRIEEHIYRWASERRFRTGTIELNDYDYLNPKKNLKTSEEATESYTRSKLKVYDFPGKYDDEGKGKKFAKIRLDGEQALDHRRHSTGDAPGLYPGGVVTLEKHPTKDENREYLVVRANHSFSTEAYRTGGGAGGDEAYFGNYEFLPKKQPFRSLMVTPKPKIHGIQTAKVIGNKGEENEEISTDAHGRIWVQFFWDHEKSISCPIRIAQVWAGKKWGGIFIPRVGMEVVVEFLEGDPDRPLVTGCVYNGDYKVPYDLPDNKTQAGLKSDSSKGHGGYNEFMFEDQKGSEKIRMHAEKDHEVTIRNSETTKIGEIFAPPKGSPSRSTTLQSGDDQLTIQTGDQTISIPAGNQTTTVAMNIATTANISITLTVGMSTVNITPGSITLTSGVINIAATSAVNIVGSAVNIGAVLNTPSLIAGAAVVGGVPV